MALTRIILLMVSVILLALGLAFIWNFINNVEEDELGPEEVLSIAAYMTRWYGGMGSGSNEVLTLIEKYGLQARHYLVNVRVNWILVNASVVIVAKELEVLDITRDCFISNNEKCYALIESRGILFPVVLKVTKKDHIVHVRLKYLDNSVLESHKRRVTSKCWKYTFAAKKIEVEVTSGGETIYASTASSERPLLVLFEVIKVRGVDDEVLGDI